MGSSVPSESIARESEDAEPPPPPGGEDSDGSTEEDDPQGPIVPPPTDEQLGVVARLLFEGRVIPFLGAGANLAERSGSWQPGRDFPSGAELAERLASRAGYPRREKDRDLLRVSQYAQAALGSGGLYEELRPCFVAEEGAIAFNSVHRLLATVPAATRERRGIHPLMITTNYDDALERALAEQGEPFDLVWYEAKSDDPHFGRFIHRLPTGEIVPIKKPKYYEDLSLERRTVILKIHGAVDWKEPSHDSYVITEDDYIGYMTEGELNIPKVLTQVMCERHLLFLGYSLRDWNMRVLLRRIWGDQPLSYNSWSIQYRVSPIEQQLWKPRGKVDIFDVSLGEYVERLARAAKEQAEVGGGIAP